MIYAVCPGGEGAALKAVGLKGLAGSNPVDGAKWRLSPKAVEGSKSNLI